MAEKIQLYNKGKREWVIDGTKISAGRTAEIDRPIAEQYTRWYPQDFVLGGPAQSGVSVRRLKTRVDALEKENAELKAEIEKLKAKKAPVAKKTEEK